MTSPVPGASVGARFDRWVGSGPFVPRDLAVYRIVFAVLVLMQAPRFRVVDGLPDFFFHPPLGPFMLLPGLPPAGVMLTVEVALSVALAALALGYRTRLASWATTLLLLYGYGVSYSVGKIDHTIFLVLLPAVLSFARWGDDLSVDAVLHRRRPPVGAPGVVSTPQWPMRLLALLVGVGFLTAAVPKIASGWLDPRSQAVRGIVNRQFFVNGRTDYLITTALQMDVTALWEVADVFAVALELSFIVCVLWWRSFRTVLAVATLFHLGVLLTMNIFFAANVLVYGAFVSWSAVGPLLGLAARPGVARYRAAAAPPSRWWEPGATGLALAGGVGVWWLRQVVDVPSTAWVILGAGALVGCWYLLRQARRSLVRLRRRDRVVDVRDAVTATDPPVRSSSR